MSTESWSEKGYGIALDYKIDLKQGNNLWEGVKALISGTKVGTIFMDNLDENENPEKYWEDVADDLAHDECGIDRNGLGWLLAEAINEKESLSGLSCLTAFDIDENGIRYVGLPAVFPFASPHHDFETNLKTEEEYDAIFRKYLPYITDTNVDHIDIGRFDATYYG